MSLVGKRVQSYVSVMGQQIAMHQGIVVEDRDNGNCVVDRGTLHGCAPWLVLEAKSHLRVIEPPQSSDGGVSNG